MGCRASKTGNFHEAYVVGGKIWQGETAQVRTVKRAYSVEDLSVRVLDVRKASSKGDGDEVDAALKRKVVHEFRVWSRVGSHENIVRSMEIVWDGPFAYIVTENCDYSLLYILERLPLLNEQTLSRFFLQAVKALNHVHGQGIVHCDIRPDNFLVSGKDFVFKLTGWSCAKFLNTEEIQGRAFLYKESGLVPYMSPEMISGKGYDFKTDIWSLGVVVYLLFYGCFPYKPTENNLDSMRQAIRKGDPAPTFEPWISAHKSNAFSPAAMTFIQALLDRNMEERPTADEALSFPYLKLAAHNEARELATKQRLLPMLCGALRSGAFEVLAAAEVENDVDLLLKFYQFPYHGQISPWLEPRPHASILKAAMESAQEATESQEPLALQALKRMRQGETAKQLGTTSWAGGGDRMVDGEFSISLADLKRLRKGEVYDGLKSTMPTGSEELSAKERPPRNNRRGGEKGKSNAEVNGNGSRSIGMAAHEADSQALQGQEAPPIGLEERGEHSEEMLVLAPGQDSMPCTFIDPEPISPDADNDDLETV
mmetsp:Transcript_19051/g.34470  ORF Transcript_19051/g.34470 Transcript_19051/m.34470 type:complete len:539 (+) Transcript_19051:68-1684(+)